MYKHYLWPALVEALRHDIVIAVVIEDLMRLFTTFYLF